MTENPTSDDPRLGLSVTHRRYVPYSHAHYAGNLVDGAYSLALFGDVAKHQHHAAAPSRGVADGSPAVGDGRINGGA